MPSFLEPNFSGDFGDFASFVAHMKKIADADSTNRLQSLGRIPACPPVSSRPEFEFDRAQSNQVFSQLPCDVLAIGNHKLYIYANALDIHQNFASKFLGRYLSSNVDIAILGPNGSPVSVPVGIASPSSRRERAARSPFSVSCMALPETVTIKGGRHGERSLGRALTSAQFADTIKDEPDLFLLVGHMPVARDNCVDFDHRGSQRNLTVNRRYLDPNRVTYKAEKSPKGLKRWPRDLTSTSIFGTALRDYTLSRGPFPSSGSLLSLIPDQVLPTALTENNTRANIPNIIITDSGSLRFDIYAGLYTKNDQLTASPFTDSFVFIVGVPLSVASAVLLALNGEGANGRRELAEAAEPYARGDVETRYWLWLEDMHASAGPERRAVESNTWIRDQRCRAIPPLLTHRS
ncbi:hypothetical protein EDB83DRAFT_2320093 [Lactarius deliciosus]|nr:hypothetical protein EDB83DRAFT_2320093 [Lactarius deliciosus]